MPWIQVVAVALLALGTSALLAFLRLADRLDAEERPERAIGRAPQGPGAPPTASRRLGATPAYDRNESPASASYPRAA